MDSTAYCVVSGGFDPLHIGHVYMIDEAAQYGRVIVICNTDEWLLRKKGYVFMNWLERQTILNSLENVFYVMSSELDEEVGSNSVCNSLRHVRNVISPKGKLYFANGGDKTYGNVPEIAACEECNIEMLWGIGGDCKSQSSSELVERMRENEQCTKQS